MKSAGVVTAGRFRVEMLCTDDCPHAAEYLPELRGLLAGAGIDVPVQVRVVLNADQAQQERFLGSPTVRVDGRDVEPGSERRRDYGLACRLYAHPDGRRGSPPDDWVLNALRHPPGSGVPHTRHRLPTGATMPPFPGLTHVAVTVSDLPRSTEWYSRLLGSEPVLDEDEESGTFHHTVFVIGGGMLFGLHTHPESPGGDQFDERSLGLDHIAFQCADLAELTTWRDRLDELGIAHGGIKQAHYGSGVSFRDPDGIALEFFAPPG